MAKSPKDNDKERLSINLLFVGASATGRFPVLCLVFLVLLWMGGKATGYW